mgnify:CR=1 FL=1
MSDIMDTMARAKAVTGSTSSQLETISQLRRRHKRERLTLMQRAVTEFGTVYEAAVYLGINRGVLYRELREAGVFVNT